jgi:hypothetical protein
MAEAKEEKVYTDFLTNDFITVKYVLRENADIKDPKHVAYGGLFNTAEISIPAPTMDNGKMKNLITDREKAGLESILKGVSLSIYGTFWKKDAYEMGILPIFLGKDEMKLDLSDPHDYIKYKVLLASPIVANSLDEIRTRATNRFVLVKEGEETSKEKDKVGYKVMAFEKYVEYKNDKSVLRYILRNLGKYTNDSHKLDFLQVEAAKLIEKDPSLFVSIAADNLIKTKVLIEECHSAGVLNKREKKFYTLDNEALSEGDIPTLEVAAAYLASPVGQEMRLTLEAKLKNTKE